MNHLSPRIVAALVLLLVVALLAPPVDAQENPPELDTFDVQVWPEYDAPTVLVIATGSLVTGTVFPQPMRIPVPTGARVHAVAYPEANGNLLSVPWTTESDASNQTVVFELDQPRFVVEYYADILTPPPSRSFSLDVVAPYAARQASLALRQPSRASAMQTTPDMVAGALDNLGNPTYDLDLGALAAGQSVPLQVSYSKPDGDPSVAGVAVDAPQPSEVSAEQNWLPLVLGIAAGALIGGGILYWVLQRRRTSTSRQARRRDARRKGEAPVHPAASASSPATGANKFCVQCGQKFESADKFCRNCGAVRR
jgi:hypothetical protein